MIIFYTWLLGVIVTGMASSYKISRDSVTQRGDHASLAEKVYLERISAHVQRWPSLDPHQYVSREGSAVMSIAGRVAAGAGLSLSWPVAAPILVAATLGRRSGESKASMRRQLEAAEVELSAIRAQEGWDKPVELSDGKSLLRSVNVS